MINKVILIGRLGQNPDLKYTQAGSPICTLSIATDESYTDREGNRIERSEWHRVSVFQRAAENCSQYLVKGSLVYVEGSLHTRKWQDQQGQIRYTTNIHAQRVIFLDRRAPDQMANPDSGYGGIGVPRGPSSNSVGNTMGNTIRSNMGNGSRPMPPRPTQQVDPNSVISARQPQNDPMSRSQMDAAQISKQHPGNDEDLGPAFPSEASNMDDMPF